MQIHELFRKNGIHLTFFLLHQGRGNRLSITVSPWYMIYSNIRDLLVSISQCTIMAQFGIRIPFAQVPYKFRKQAGFQLVFCVYHVFHFAVVELIQQSTQAQTYKFTYLSVCLRPNYTQSCAIGVI